MPEVQIRKKLLLVEEIFHEGGPVAPTPLRRAAALVVIRNPYAGGYVEKIEGFMDDLKPLGLEMARSLLAALGSDPKVVEGYGKGAIWARRGRSNTGRSGMCPAAMRCVMCSEARRRLWRRRRRLAVRAPASTFRSPISTPPTCAAILMRWRWALRMLRAPMKLCSRS